MQNWMDGFQDSIDLMEEKLSEELDIGTIAGKRTSNFSYCCFLRCMISLLRNSLYFASLRIGCSLSRFIRSSMF